ncbi:MAG: CorA family divalent cation transporter, partial [Ignavibacteria bacterium]
MRTFIKKRSVKSGLPPGTLIHIGEKKSDAVKINVMDYDENHVTEKEIKDLNECFAFKELPSITWIDIEGLHDIDLLEKLGNHFGLHPLVQEDILNTDQRPKLEEFDNYVYIVLKMFHQKKSGNEVIPEQVSIILGKNFV